MATDENNSSDENTTSDGNTLSFAFGLRDGKAWVHSGIVAEAFEKPYDIIIEEIESLKRECTDEFRKANFSTVGVRLTNGNVYYITEMTWDGFELFVKNNPVIKKPAAVLIYAFHSFSKRKNLVLISSLSDNANGLIEMLQSLPDDVLDFAERMASVEMERNLQDGMSDVEAADSACIVILAVLFRIIEDSESNTPPSVH
ncbi:MAG: hypothetical protein HQL74_07400 [Magnetococcales bacterium]|nr:hypothetical protein [Magnetococcales bacterium]